MNLLRQLLTLSAIFWLSAFFLPRDLSAQQQKDIEALAIEYFNHENYEEAYPLFAELLKYYPGDGPINYYYGVSLVRSEHFTAEARKALLNASRDKKTPANAIFYLANCYHAAEEWITAMDYYQEFEKTARKKEHREVNLDEYMMLCSDQSNPFKRAIERETASPKSQQQAHTPTTQQPTFTQESNNTVTVEANFVVPQALETSWFSFQINPKICYHRLPHFKSEKAMLLFAKGWEANQKQDALAQQTEKMRDKFVETEIESEKWDIAKKIIDAEQRSYKLMRDREKYFIEARKLESLIWEMASADEIERFEAKIQKEEKIQKEDKLASMVSELKKPAKAPTPSTTTPKPEPKEMGIKYKIQLGAYSKALPIYVQNLYNKIGKSRTIEHHTNAKGIVIYTVGNLTDYKTASKLKNQIRQEGVEGAFVVAYQNGERIRVNEALKIQNSN